MTTDIRQEIAKTVIDLINSQRITPLTSIQAQRIAGRFYTMKLPRDADAKVSRPNRMSRYKGQPELFPGTLEEISRKHGLSIAEVCSIIRKHKRRGLVHSPEWVVSGSYTARVYAFGPGENVPMPERKPRQKKPAIRAGNKVLAERITDSARRVPNSVFALGAFHAQA